MAKKNQQTPDLRATENPEPMVLQKGNICPGDCVSIAQYISSVPIRLPHTTGKDPTNMDYVGGKIFV